MLIKKFDAAFIGRFQPFHNGHLQAVLDILKNEKNLLIIVGTTQESGTKKNPFSYELRLEMILNSLKEYNVDLNCVKVVPLPDINDDTKWVQYLINSVPKFKVMYTGSTETAKLFNKYSDKKIKNVNFLNGVSGTLVREKLARGLKIEDLVPNSVLKLI